jgi:response regulator RpfG family c-di-GMP phosphodiesterase
MTDVVMPEMNGRELGRKPADPVSRAQTRLFMSGYTANVIAHHGVLDAGVHFIQKPFQAKILPPRCEVRWKTGEPAAICMHIIPLQHGQIARCHKTTEPS